MTQADVMAYELRAAPAARANFAVVGLAVLYVAWQYLMPVILVLAPFPGMGLAGVLLGFALVIDQLLKVYPTNRFCYKTQKDLSYDKFYIFQPEL